MEFEEAVRLCAELKRLKLVDLEFANDVTTPSGDTVDTAEPARLRKQARDEAAELFKKRRR